MSTPHPRSIRLTFDNSQPNALRLVRALACQALPYGSHDTGDRQGITGFWVQLENSEQAVIYRRDHPGLMLPRSRDRDVEELKRFDVLVPYTSKATSVAIFAPPRDANGHLPYLGAASELVGRFPFPALEDLDSSPAPPSLPSDICGQGRGQVISVVNAVYHGRIDHVYNLVILADKFGKDQDEFLQEANNCISYLLSQPPFNSVFGSDAMNIFFVEVQSNSSNPSYFNSTYSKGSTYIDWDWDCVAKVCDTLFSVNGHSYWNWAGLIINYDSERIGTQRGSQFAVGIYESLGNDDNVLTFQHEFGHAGFGLGDEYGGTDGTYNGVEPGNPNLTKETALSQLKWKDLVSPGVAIPTLGNPSNCNKEDNRSNPVEDSEVGSYAGGISYSCDIFHPQYKCVMNQQSDADGAFCAVCLHEATTILASAAPLNVPAPGSLFYSPISQSWSHAQIAANVIDTFSELQNYPQYADVVAELQAGTAGAAVQAAFQTAGHTLPPTVEVFESYYDPGTSDGVWYLIAQDTQITYYVHAFEVAMDSELALGQIALPDFPSVTLFDGAVVGTEINLFCADGKKLSYGQLDSSGNLINGQLTPQSVTGLNDEVSSISVDFLNSSIWTVVVDELGVKIAAFQPINAAWWQEGFVLMPTSEPTDFDSVRMVQAGNLVHVLARSNAGLAYNSFQTVLGAWSGNAAATPINNSVGYFDVTTDAKYLYAIAELSGAVSFCQYDINAGTWGEPVDISQSLGLASASVLSSLGITVLNTTLHVVALVNQQAQYAMFDLSTSTWTQPLEDIAPLNALDGKMGAMMVHSTPTQVYVGLSGVTSPSAP